MRVSWPMKSPAAAVALLYASVSAAAAPPSQTDLVRLVEQLNQRMERLEQHNAELERELGASLESDTISEKEPEITARLKALESQAVSAQSAARKVEAFEGITAGLSLTTVAQKPLGAASGSSQLNYRGDAYVSLPLAALGDIEHRVFAQFRPGQGSGVSAPSFSSPNSSAFQLDGGLRPDDSVALLAQAWYQASISLPFGGYKPHSKQTLEVNFGKMDPFVFFDQNPVAGDETRQFLNSAFVHNPLLDAGGDIGVDANGFSPGLRLSYANVASKPETWRLSLGVFGAGANGSNYQRSLSSPLVMLQAETEQRMFRGLVGTYRIYAWRNAQASHFDSSLTEPEHHSGWGISADQRVGDGVTLFGRYGHQMQGHVSFDRALTLGADVNGSYWSRGGDSVGLAAGWLKTSQNYRDFTAGTTPAGGAERIAELYYRFRINPQFELSPSFQYIGNPAGDGSVEAVKILGLRAQLTY